MNNDMIAKLLAKEVFNTHKDNSLGYAIQLFVEKAVLPDEVDDYGTEDIKKYILEFLETR